jgi:hypothetical protein
MKSQPQAMLDCGYGDRRHATRFDPLVERVLVREANDMSEAIDRQIEAVLPVLDAELDRVGQASCRDLFPIPGCHWNSYAVVNANKTRNCACPKGVAWATIRPLALSVRALRVLAGPELARREAGYQGDLSRHAAGGAAAVNNERNRRRRDTQLARDGGLGAAVLSDSGFDVFRVHGEAGIHVCVNSSQTYNNNLT